MMDDARAPGLPASIGAAWGLAEGRKRGPKPGLSLDRIVSTAVQVAAGDGLAAVSMNRVARDLGTSAMSLYRYVAAKEELVALMVDAALGPAPAPSSDQETWRDGLSRWAWAQREEMHRHPWAVQVPISGPPVTPNQIAWLESALQSLGRSRLTENEKMSAVLVVTSFVRIEVTLAANFAAAAAARRGHDVMAAWGAVLRHVVDSERFPALNGVIKAGVFEEPDDPDAEFVFGLERVLDGIEVLVKSRDDEAAAVRPTAGRSTSRARQPQARLPAKPPR